MNAIVSGGTKGIGRAIAFALAKAGYNVAIGARTANDLEEVQYSLNSQYPAVKVLTKACDFSKKDEIDAFASFVKNEWKSIDVLVNNVGIYTLGTVSEDTEGALEKTMEANLYSAYYLTRAFLDDMKTKQRGHIFNLCSIISKFPRMDAASYTISKFAMLGFNRVLCQEMRNYNVKVTAVLPGSTNTASWDGFNAPTDEFVQPEDVALAVVNALNMSPSSLVEEIIIKPVNNEL